MLRCVGAGRPRVGERVRRPLASLGALGLLGSAAPGAAAADPAACRPACPPPRLEAAEPALHLAVHLAWSDAHRDLARRYEVARRPVGSTGAWTAVARVGAAAPPHADDRGSAGAGLAPGEYEYRLRALHRTPSGDAWSEWSPPRAVALRPACVEAGGELTGLQRVVADDRDGDGRHTGADLERALRDCSRLGGCILEALPTVYDDVAILLYDGYAPACTPERTACLDLPFPNGLAIEGHGSATVLRSPLWHPPYLPMPLLELWRRPDLRIQVRHLVLDGRKAEQRAPHPGTNDAPTWWHYGFQTWNQWTDHDRRNRGGCIHDVAVRGFMCRGIVLADVARWSIERNRVEDIGCDAELTPCPRLELREEDQAFVSGGFGIFIGWHSDDVAIRENRIRRVTKYAIGLKHGNEGDVTSIRRPRVLGNQIEDTGTLGIFVGGVAEGRFEANRIAAVHDLDERPEANAYNDTFGISCVGAAERTAFVDNRLADLAGMAVNWQCSGLGNYLAGTRVSGSCREKGPASCSPSRPGECYVQPDVYVGIGATGTLALVDGEVAQSGCAAPLGADLLKPELELLIRGGRYAAGPKAVRPVRFQGLDVLIERGTAFTGTALEFGRGARGVVAPSVSVAGTREPFRIDPSARVLACPAQPSACQKLCASPTPPAWCAGGEAAASAR
jgi:hypothetical protein